MGNYKTCHSLLIIKLNFVRQPHLHQPTDKSDGAPTSIIATHERPHAHKHELHPFLRHLKEGKCTLPLNSMQTSGNPWCVFAAQVCHNVSPH